MMPALAWGAYLACSWIWCIALFLPVILAADTGPGTWPVFAACNIAGVSILPFVIRTRQGSLAFVQRNLAACRVFSVVTIMCQAWFMGWAASRLPWPLAVAALACVAAFLIVGRSDRRWQALAAVTLLATLAAFGAYLATSPHARLASTVADELAWHPRTLYAVPLLFAGFIFSPCLDLTFHHALQADPQPRRAFQLVFPVLFGITLLFSLAYRDELASTMLRPATVPTPAWLLPTLAILVVQVGFTMALHASRLPQRPGTFVKVAAGALAAACVAWLLGDDLMPTGQTLNEFAYRSSIGFYGVLVPCWVWIGTCTAVRPGFVAFALAGTALLLAAVPMLLAPAQLFLYPVAMALMALTPLVAGIRLRRCREPLVHEDGQ